MYRPANYYAARAAAIKEALEDQRAALHARAAIQQKMPNIPSAEALRDCGKPVTVILGASFGEFAGTMIQAVFCYSVTPSMYLAKIDLEGRVYFGIVASYSKRDDLYNLVISVEAVV